MVFTSGTIDIPVVLALRRRGRVLCLAQGEGSGRQEVAHCWGSETSDPLGTGSVPWELVTRHPATAALLRGVVRGVGLLLEIWIVDASTL